MWTYKQSTGELVNSASTTVAMGYSGALAGKNNPAMQEVPNVGPIPQGHYTIGAPFTSPEHGPFAMHLTPDPSNRMYKRAGFLMHGDSLEHPGCASEGCIIMSRTAREQAWDSGDHALEVVA